VKYLENINQSINLFRYNQCFDTVSPCILSRYAPARRLKRSNYQTTGNENAR